MRRSRALAAVIVCATAALTACSMVPSDGPVTPGLTNLRQSDQFVQFDPSGPVPGSTQEDIVRGFVSAASSTANNYAVAREFLTPDYANQWEPSSGVMIDDSTRPYRDSGEDVGVLSISTVATVDEQGVLSALPPGPTTELRFELERSGNEWRISSAPAGVVLDRNTFTAVWSPHPLYFLTGSGDLVADPRWFPSRTNLATKIVQGLVNGPSEALQRVVQTTFPRGTQLTGGGVEITDGTAKVDLTQSVGSLSAPALERIGTQLSHSLQSLSNVTAYTLSVEGQEVRSDVVQPYVSAASENRPPVALLDDRLGVVDAAGVSSALGLSERVAEIPTHAISLAEGGELAVLRTPSGTRIVTPESSTMLDARNSIVGAGVDPQGYVWSALSTPDARLRAILPGQQDLSLDPLEPGQRLEGVRLSPDGNWLAYLLDDGDGTQVRLAAVERDDTGAPTGFSERRITVLWTSGTARDLDWIDDARIAVLTEVGKSGKITVGTVGGFTTDRGTVPHAVSLAGTSARGQVRVLTSKGELLAPQGVSGWQLVRDGVDVLAKWG